MHIYVYIAHSIDIDNSMIIARERGVGEVEIRQGGINGGRKRQQKGKHTMQYTDDVLLSCTQTL